MENEKKKMEQNGVNVSLLYTCSGSSGICGAGESKAEKDLQGIHTEKNSINVFNIYAEWKKMDRKNQIPNRCICTA